MISIISISLTTEPLEFSFTMKNKSWSGLELMFWGEGVPTPYKEISSIENKIIAKHFWAPKGLSEGGGYMLAKHFEGKHQHW